MAITTRKPVVLVTGDRIRDHNLHARPVGGATTHLDPRQEAVDQVKPGGAWYVESLMRAAAPEGALDVRGADGWDRPAGDAGSEPAVSHAYSFWAQFPERTGEKKRIAWRIQSFLGCALVNHAERTTIRGGDDPAPDVLVIDDLDLGFRRSETSWPAALQKSGADPRHIVLKTREPLARGPLWTRLRELGFLPRTTVVISVTALRAERAAISPGLSWDLAVEQVVREFELGASARDLAECARVVVLFDHEGVAAFTRGALPDGTGWGETAPRTRFERFVYDPTGVEGTWLATHEGGSSGKLAILTAAVARQIARPEDCSWFFALGRGLAASRASHAIGGGSDPKSFSVDASTAKVHAILGHQALALPDNKLEPAAEFRSAFPHPCGAGPGQCSDILSDFTGPGPEYALAAAVDVVVRGPDKALGAAPRARFGGFLTADRMEIERIHALRNLILAYRQNPADTKPLSVAVFGPPGAGKSFAIKQLAGALLPGSPRPLEFNLSQMATVSDLRRAFHKVRDESVRGAMPLVFWDEFDTAPDDRELPWLRHFLAPMQDAEFVADGATHAFGRAIFVFAGGTRSTFEGFDRSRAGGEDEKTFRKVKGPDFVSRLRGYLDVKGPNAIATTGTTEERRSTTLAKRRIEDPAYVLRRAIMLRSHLERRGLVSDETKFSNVSPGVVRAFLRVGDFLHGARSLEAIVSMSRIAAGGTYGVADLPTPNQVALHVAPDADFLGLADGGFVDAEVVESLAHACHGAWFKANERQGRKNPVAVPYGDLDENGKEANRLTARVVQAKLDAVGYDIVPRRHTDTVPTEIPDPLRTKLMEIEHEIWMRDLLLKGFEYAPATEKRLFRHRDIVEFARVPPDDKVFDQVIVDTIVPTLWAAGFRLALRSAGA